VSRQASGFNVGQPFNPYKLFTGIFVPEAVCKYRGLTPGAKVVYGRLCRYAGKDGAAYPAISTLASEMGMGQTQARGYVGELEEKRFIKVDRQNRHYRKDGSGGSNGYVFLWHEAFAGEIGEPRKAPPPLRKTGGVPLRKTGVLTPSENRRERESIPRESVKESHSTATKADIQPTNRKKRGSPVGSKTSVGAKRQIKEPAYRGDWDEEELEAMQEFIEDNEPDDTDDHGQGEWAAQATLDAGMGATAGEVLGFLASLVESGWTAPNYRAFPAVVHHEFERRRNKAAGARWSTEHLAMLRAALKKWMEGDEPPERFAESCELRANGATARQVFNLLNRRWNEAKYRPGGKHAPRKWAWFLKVIGAEFSELERCHLPEQPAAAGPNVEQEYNRRAIAAIELPDADVGAAA
jgi:hypothetical protein